MVPRTPSMQPAYLMLTARTADPSHGSEGLFLLGTSESYLLVESPFFHIPGRPAKP